MLETRGLLVAAHFFEGFGFDLPYAFAGDAEFFTDIFEGMVNAIEQTISHFYNPALFLRKFLENFHKLVTDDAAVGLLVRRKYFIVRKEVAKGGLTIIPIFTH